tara:strand:- start:153 stop:1277 length:1125 start_codon:yes stop_codon:yes gene_type:complete
MYRAKMAKNKRSISERKRTRIAARRRNALKQQEQQKHKMPPVKKEKKRINGNISAKDPNKNKDYFIIFALYSLHTGSSWMRGKQLARALAKTYQYVFINPSLDKNFETYKPYVHLKTVVFTIKAGFLRGTEKLNNPFYIWDVVDWAEYFTLKKDKIITYEYKYVKKKYDKCHLINCANSKQIEYFCPQNNPKDRIFDCIPHNWDSKFRDITPKALNNEKLPEPKFAYIGTPNKKDPTDSKFRNYKDITYLGQVAKKKDIGTFNVCASFRSEFNSIYKPGTKCAVAASFNSAFIANKHEYGVYDLLGPDYPYYLEKTNQQNMENMIKYIKDTYKTPIWDKAMKIIKEVKEKTDVRNIAKQFIKHIENHFNDKSLD